ncbi:MAG: TetR/AcrR family transcriptional regulator [Tissierellia bacterium]|nr:TetR/AcrR family transcriptional regulator [Tissierellia bacterium]
MDESYELTRKKGISAVNTAVVSKAVGCSVQPIYSYFKNMDDLKTAIYEKAMDEFMERANKAEHDFYESVLEYVRFASDEKKLFSLLFLADGMIFSEKDRISGKSGAHSVFINILHGEEKNKTAFDLFIFAHGLASLIANDKLLFEELSLEEYMEQIKHKLI